MRDVLGERGVRLGSFKPPHFNPFVFLFIAQRGVGTENAMVILTIWGSRRRISDHSRQIDDLFVALVLPVVLRGLGLSVD